MFDIEGQRRIRKSPGRSRENGGLTGRQEVPMLPSINEVALRTTAALPRDKVRSPRQLFVCPQTTVLGVHSIAIRSGSARGHHYADQRVLREKDPARVAEFFYVARNNPSVLQSDPCRTGLMAKLGGRSRSSKVAQG